MTLLRTVLASSLVVGSLALVGTPAQADYRGTYPAVYNSGNKCDSDQAASKCREVQTYVDFLNSTRCDDTVTAAVYSLTVPEVYYAWERLIKCDAHVYIVWSKPKRDGEEFDASYWLDKLVKLKGKNYTVKRVTGSGMAGGKAGTQHLKQATRKSDGRSIQPSWNTSYATDRDAWNGGFDQRDVKIANATFGVIRASAKDKKQSACRFNTKGTDPRRAIFFQPCKTDPVLAILKSAHAGSGCEWYYQMFMVTHYAVPKINELKRLGREGCKVHVLVNYGGTWSNDLIADLLHQKNIDVHDASYDPKHPKVHVYLHAKRNMGKGLKVGSKPYEFVSDGAANDTGESYTTSTNFIETSTVPDEVKAAYNWSKLAHDSSRTLTYASFCKKVNNKQPKGC